MEMSFFHQDKQVTLHDVKPTGSLMQDGEKFFKKPARKGLLLQIMQQTGADQMQQLVPELQTLLDEFAIVFEDPKGLPPSRGHEH